MHQTANAQRAARSGHHNQTNCLHQRQTGQRWRIRQFGRQCSSHSGNLLIQNTPRVVFRLHLYQIEIISELISLISELISLISELISIISELISLISEIIFLISKIISLISEKNY